LRKTTALWRRHTLSADACMTQPLESCQKCKTLSDN
jgi:hypothetical protein